MLPGSVIAAGALIAHSPHAGRQTGAISKPMKGSVEMLNVTINNLDANTDFEFHLGDVFRQLASFEDIVSVQADGDELDFIIDHFQGIPLAWSPAYLPPLGHAPEDKPRPKRPKRVQIWHGDLARFIYYNFHWFMQKGNI